MFIEDPPLFKHDCNDCVYLGSYHNGKPFDLYICHQKTIVCRYGDIPSNYASAPIASALKLGCKSTKSADISMWLTAIKRAVKKNLIDEKLALKILEEI